MYSIRINGGEPRKVEPGKNGQVSLDDNATVLDMIATGPSAFHVIRDGKSYRVEVIRLDREEKIVVLKINGRKFTAELKDKFDVLMEQMGLSGMGAGKLNEFKAPMPGLVLDIFVQEGSQVNKGEPLLVLEAMKMENMLKAPGDGIVKKIHVERRQAVEKNQVLISFE